MTKTLSRSTPRYVVLLRGGIAAIALVLLASVTSRGTGPKFFADDPIEREPETQDASTVEAWDIDLFIDLATNRAGTRFYIRVCTELIQGDRARLR